LATLEYGKSLRDYDEEQNAEKPYRVFGTNGPIGWHSASLCHREGIVVGRKGAYRGIHFSPQPFFVIDTAFYLSPKAEFDIKWAYYQLRNFDINKLDSGSAIPSTSREAFYEIPVSIPPLSIQHRIADILSTYDELIENNQRRIKILEEMARSLYREWFVLFRFPGHDKAKMVSSPLGPIPQSWEVKTIADLCESVSYGYTASAVREGIGPKFLRITDIVPDVIEWDRVPFCEIPAGNAPKYLVKPGDIVIARTGATTGYAKRLNKRHPEAVFASYLVRIRAHVDISNLMLGLLIESDDYKQFIKTNIGGAAQPQANAVVLTSMRLAVPPSPLGEAFDRLVEPLLDEAELLAIKIQNLRRTRDLLLPRLLSGATVVSTFHDIST
jgi:type I restriction enzyme S subunit